MAFKCFISTPESVKNIAEEFRKMAKRRKHHMNFKLKKMSDKDKCNLVLVYCPIVSRAGTDIQATLDKIKTEFSGKWVILIVLHHTFDPEISVSDSSKFDDSNVDLTVDCLFHEDQGLLKCERNSKATRKVKRFLKQKSKSNKKTDIESSSKVGKADQL
ncbi:hypothetical protein E1301_Tti017317 [Triplophysa tibetana]|uniref:Uncharacterized protein n=1 Tax=Triplophysa tibetana TaxID=1572043 RepID=A0A5A9P5N4_9TELE|nr:hypothetical protein E1301_Tti017317 [Triplophysa tibetana]